jgi:hypothetical protein
MYPPSTLTERTLDGASGTTPRLTIGSAAPQVLATNANTKLETETDR